VNLITSTIFRICVLSFAFGHVSSLRNQIRGLGFGAGQCNICFGFLDTVCIQTTPFSLKQISVQFFLCDRQSETQIWVYQDLLV
jgi:hypothetical protein